MSKEDWVWQGYAGHYWFCGYSHYRLCTVVNNGKYIIRTIGDIRDEYENLRTGMGNTSEKLFNTCVYETEKCNCGCNEYIPKSHELGEIERLEQVWCTTATKAYENHLKLCEKWSE